MRILLGCLIGLFWVTVAQAVCTTTTANLQQTTVQNAITAATGGAMDSYVICLPPGTQTWTTTSSVTPSVTLNKGVTLQGTTVCSGSPVTCVDGTIINDGTNAGFDEGLLKITGTNARVTGITWKDPRGIGDAKEPITMNCANCRFDHNSFPVTPTTLDKHGVYVYSKPTSTQLIDHNYFKDLGGGVDVDGTHPSDFQFPGDFSWESTLVPGSANATYIEDNHFDYSSSSVGVDGAWDSYAGARLVFRYNTVKRTSSGSHGLDSGGLRSSLLHELYRNTASNTDSAIYTWANSRGGTHFIFENTISASAGSFNIFFAYQSYRSDDGCTDCASWGICNGANFRDQNTSGQQGYICRDQIGRGPETAPTTDWPRLTSSITFSEAAFPAYSFANTYKGAIPTISNVDIRGGPTSDVRAQTFHLINNRDFFMEVSGFNGTTGTGSGSLLSRPGFCTTGVAYWATDQGSWNTSGDGRGSGVLYKCTSTNNWSVYYTPYTYPHPLQGASGSDTTPPSAPTNLRVTGFYP